LLAVAELATVKPVGSRDVIASLIGVPPLVNRRLSVPPRFVRCRGQRVPPGRMIRNAGEKGSPAIERG
jgi:hypothetical protein